MNRPAKIRLSIGIGAALFTSSLIAGCAQQSLPIPEGTDTHYTGYIKEGEKFGVAVGETRARARELLESDGIRYMTEYHCGYHLKILIDCTGELTSDVYWMDAFLRHGKIFLLIENDRVSAIAWHLEAISGPDF